MHSFNANETYWTKMDIIWFSASRKWFTALHLAACGIKVKKSGSLFTESTIGFLKGADFEILDVYAHKKKCLAEDLQFR